MSSLEDSKRTTCSTYLGGDAIEANAGYEAWGSVDAASGLDLSTREPGGGVNETEEVLAEDDVGGVRLATGVNELRRIVIMLSASMAVLGSESSTKYHQ